MKRSSLVEIVGLLSIVLSLVFVGYEIQENTRLASAQALLDLSALSHENLTMQAQSPQLVKIILKATSDLESLTPVEAFQNQQFIYSYWNTYEVAFKFYRKGVLSDEDFKPWLDSMCTDYASADVREVLGQGFIVMDERFMALVRRECAIQTEEGSELKWDAKE